MVKHIAKIVLGEELYNIKDTEVRSDLNNHASNTDIHVTAAEKEYWNSKVNPPSYSAPTAKQLTYTGEAQELLNPGSSTSGSIQYSTDEVNWSTTVPQATNAGTYTVYWKFAGSEIVYVDSTAINVTIAKANPTYTAPTAKSGFVYNTTAQDLLNAGSTSDGTISYSEDNENWSSSVPSKTNAGDYTIYWKLTGDANHNDVASTAISVSIAKVTPTVTAPTAKTGLVYDGTAQELVNAGSTDYGTLQYSLDNETYSTSIPSGINAGDYTVYYKVVGDSNINDVAAQSVSCSISKVNRSVTISDNSTTLVLGATNTITVTTEGSPTIIVTSSNTNVATVNGMTVTAIGYGTSTITVTVAGDTNYNEYTYSYTVSIPYPPNGIYAVYSDGSLRTSADADSNALGVAVISDNCKFIIDKQETKGPWDEENLGMVPGCSAFGLSDNNIYSDFVGRTNTEAITAFSRDINAAYQCSRRKITIAGIQKIGYLWAFGELYTAYQNKTDIQTMMSTIGGTSLSGDYWSSTQFDNANVNNAFGLDWGSGRTQNFSKTSYSVKFRPVFPI